MELNAPLASWRLKGATIIHFIAIFVALGWLVTVTGPSETGMAIFAAICVVTLCFVPWYPLIGVYCFLLVVYGLPRYDGAVDYIFANFVPEWVAIITSIGWAIWYCKLSDRRTLHFSTPTCIMLLLFLWSGISTLQVIWGGFDLSGLREAFDVKHHPMRYFNAFVMFLVVHYAAAPVQTLTRIGLLLGLTISGKWFLFEDVIRVRPGDIALLASMSVPLSLAVLESNRSWSMRSFAAVNLSVGLWIIWACQNRGAVLAILSVAVYLSYRYLHLRNFIIVMLCSALLVAITMYSTEFGGRFKAIAGNVENGSDAGVHERLSLWRAAFPVVRDHWLFGVGPGRSPRYLAQHTPENINQSYAVHNNFLAVAMELGIIGLTLYVLLLFGTLSNLVKRKGDVLRTLSAPDFLAAAIIAYLIAGCFITRHDQALAYVLVGMAAGLSNNLREKQTNYRSAV